MNEKTKEFLTLTGIYLAFVMVVVGIALWGPNWLLLGILILGALGMVAIVAFPFGLAIHEVYTGQIKLSYLIVFGLLFAAVLVIAYLTH